DTGIVGYLQSGWDSFKGLFSTAGSGIWDTLKSGYSGAIDLMGDTGIVGYLQTGWDSFKGLFTTAGTGIWDTLKSGYSGVISTLGSTSIVSSTWQSWKDFAGDAGKWIGNIWTSFTGLLSSMAGVDIKGWLRPAWDAFSGFFSNGASGIWDVIKSGYSTVVKALSESDLTMNFVATVSGAWNSILALINKGWDLASGLDWSFSQGGMVPGYASGGDSPTNDTVLARVSPREYIEPRSAVNSETIGMLEYIRQNKALPYGYFEGGYIPGYADGGLVDTWKGMLGDYRMPFKPTSRLDEVFASQNVSTNDSGMSSIGGWNLYDGTNGRKGQLYLDKQEAEAGIISPKYPVWSEQIGDNLKRIYYYDGSTEESEMSVGMGWWQEFLERWGAKLTMTLAAAAITYGVGSGVGAALGATAGGVAGAGAGGLMGYMSGKGEGGWLSAIIGAVGGAVGGYYSGGGGDLGEIVSDMAGAAKYNAVIGAGGTLADAGAAYDVAFKAAMLSQGIDSVLNFAESGRLAK
ncbi:MAG: hypothetical protein NTY86_18700, partial [Deltaproteobacteria bacterium]|nr:hypothetical protein [Deltaproteobacteria bacterium]